MRTLKQFRKSSKNPAFVARGRLPFIEFFEPIIFGYEPEKLYSGEVRLPVAAERKLIGYIRFVPNRPDQSEFVSVSSVCTLSKGADIARGGNNKDYIFWLWLNSRRICSDYVTRARSEEKKDVIEAVRATYKNKVVPIYFIEHICEAVLTAEETVRVLRNKWQAQRALLEGRKNAVV